MPEANAPMLDDMPPAPNLAPKKAPGRPKKAEPDGSAAMKAEMAAMKKSIAALEDERDEAVADSEAAAERIEMLEKSTVGVLGNTPQEPPKKGKKAPEDTHAHARRLDRSKPYGEISPPWNGAIYSQGPYYFAPDGLEITTLRQANQVIIDPGLADAQAKARSEAINLAAWAEGLEDYADADVFRAIRDRFFKSVSSIHDAIDVLIEKKVVQADKQKRSRIQDD